MRVWSLGQKDCPGGGHGNPLQYSCLENPMDRGAWRATVHSVTKSRTRLKQLSMHTSRVQNRSISYTSQYPEVYLKALIQLTKILFLSNWDIHSVTFISLLNLEICKDFKLVWKWGSHQTGKDTRLGVWRLGFSAQLLISHGMPGRHPRLAGSQFPHP